MLVFIVPRYFLSLTKLETSIKLSYFCIYKVYLKVNLKRAIETNEYLFSCKIFKTKGEIISWNQQQSPKVITPWASWSMMMFTIHWKNTNYSTRRLSGITKSARCIRIWGEKWAQVKQLTKFRNYFLTCNSIQSEK